MNYSTINLFVNGNSQTTNSPITLPNFLESQGFNLRLIAVEYNGEILHRQFWPDTQLQDGDRLEVVTIVGGG